MFKRQFDRSLPDSNGFYASGPTASRGWFRFSFWVDHIFVKVGSYLRKGSPVSWDIRNLLRIEFNPNRVGESPVLSCIFSVLFPLVDHGYLKECDYTVDVEAPLNQIVCFSKKQRITVGHNRYYGKRHTDGRIKIYDKAKELREVQKADFDGILSRAEVTCTWNGACAFDECVLLSGGQSAVQLSTNLRTIFSLIVILQLHGEDAEDLLLRYVPDKRNRDKLIPYLIGDTRFPVFSVENFAALITDYAVMYHFGYMFKTFSYGLKQFDSVSIGEGDT